MRTGPPAESAPCQPTVVVLGGGINGAALARQLVLAGTSVVIADTGDLAGGTTAWSTRLIHGGLRYLEYGEFDLVRESLAERNRLVRLAPHLVRPLPFAIPLQGGCRQQCKLARPIHPHRRKKTDPDECQVSFDPV